MIDFTQHRGFVLSLSSAAKSSINTAFGKDKGLTTTLLQSGSLIGVPDPYQHFSSENEAQNGPNQSIRRSINRHGFARCSSSSISLLTGVLIRLVSLACEHNPPKHGAAPPSGRQSPEELTYITSRLLVKHIRSGGKARNLIPDGRQYRRVPRTRILDRTYGFRI